MVGRRIKVRRTRGATSTTVLPTESVELSGKLAVYQIRVDTRIGELGEVKVGQRVLLPYTEKFWGDPRFLLLRELEG